MRYRLPLLLMFALSLVAISPAFGQRRDITKWEVSPFVGYETGGSYPVNNSFVIDRLRVDGGLSFGTFIDYSLTENSPGRIHVESQQHQFQRARRGHSYLFESI